MPTFLTRPQSHPLRRGLFQLHLWTGLILALYVILIGTTGALLVFRPELQKATFPQFFTIPHSTPDAPITQIISQLHTHYPDAQLSGIDFPTARRATYLSYLTRGNDFLAVFSHPVTAEPMGELPKTSWITRLQDLHFDLLSGPTGRTINGIAAATLIAMFTTGLILWWPGPGRILRALWIPARSPSKRLNWDLHTVTGFWLFALLMLWAVTGVEFAFPRAFRRAVNAVSPLTVSRPPESTPSTKPQLDAPTLLALARREVPDSKPGRVVLPSSPKAAAQVLMARIDHGDFDTSDETLLYFDQYTGALLQKRITAQEQSTAGDVFLKWIGPLHLGSFAGLGTKILWSILALSFPTLAITGFLMWKNRP